MENIVDTEMSTFVIDRDDQAKIKFKGYEIASVRNTDNRACGTNYSGRTGEWQELTLYKTSGGNYVCQRIYRTRWANACDSYEAKLVKTEEAVRLFFGYSELAKDLYYEAKLADYIIVD